ncbi:MAG: hypothetical protein EOO05_14880 [Chitinophagaceae bacterium]|nr:MAG: hypothetical protein EOO05_14880 [Chitinophagaceae bacterium]
MQTSFPVTYSTLEPAALSAWLGVTYGFTGNACSFILRGVGDTYLVSSGEARYILRIYRHALRTRQQVIRETSLLDLLRQHNVSVSYPVADLSGQLVNTLQAPEGPRFAVVFSFAEGRSFHIMNDQQLANLGHEVAAFHNVSSLLEKSEGDRVFDLETMLHEPLRRVRPYFASAAEDLEWLDKMIAGIYKKVDAVDTSGFSAGFIQFDLLPKNYHFDAQDKVTLFDFDFVGYGWLLLDIMTFWVHTELDVHVGRQTRAAGDKSFKTFIDAYRSVREIRDAELELIPYLSLGFWIFYMGFHESHDGFYGFVKEPGHLKVRMGLIRGLLEKVVVP